MNTSPAGAEIIKKAEGLKLKPYLCPAGVLTVGYGHTGNVKGTITEAEAEALLKADLLKFEEAVLKHVRVPLKQHQFDALVSFVYNVGTGAFANSTLVKLLNQGKYKEAADQFPRWNKSNGKVLPGLVTRRAKERELFLNNV